MAEGGESESARSRRKWNIAIAVIFVLVVAGLLYSCTKQGSPAEKSGSGGRTPLVVPGYSGERWPAAYSRASARVASSSSASASL